MTTAAEYAKRLANANNPDDESGDRPNNHRSILSEMNMLRTAPATNGQKNAASDIQPFGPWDEG